MRVFNLVIMIWVICGCSSVRVISEYEPAADFSAYSTFNFVQVEKPVVALSPFMHLLNQRRIEYAITAEMGMRDYILSNKPDLRISYGIEPASGNKPIEDGTLWVKITDSRTSQPVWSGRVKGALEDVTGEPTEALEEAIRALFARYPYLAARKERFGE